MSNTVTLEIPAGREAIVRRFLALHDELEALALSAPDGTVLDACERRVLEGGRDLQRQLLADAVARRIESAEKKGRRSASAPAAKPSRTAVPRCDNSSLPSA